MFKRQRIYFRQDGPPGGSPPGSTNLNPPGGTLVPLDAQAAAAKAAEIEKENAALKLKNQQLEKQFSDGSKKLEELHSTIVSPEYMEFLQTKRRGGEGARQGGQPQQITEEEINSMDNTQLANFMLKNMEGMLTKHLSPLSQKTEQIDAAAQVRSVAEKFSDYWDYREAMIPIAERNPRMDPMQIYLMVKGMEVATGKSFKAPKQGSEGNEGEERGSSSQRGGARPLSGEIGSGPDTSLGNRREEQPNSYADAAGKAFDKIFGR